MPDQLRRRGSRRHRGPFSRRLVSAAVVLLALLASAGALIATELPGPAAAASTATKLVPGYLNYLKLATVTGAPSPGQLMTIGVGLSRPDGAAESSLEQAMYTPGSAEYHQFLTPAQFDAQFGVPVAETDAVRGWLQGGGLTIDPDGADDYVTATGTVAQLDALFGVTIRDYTYTGADGHTEDFIANDAPPSVPSDLPIDAVLGLDNVHQFHLAPLHTGASSQAASGSSAVSGCTTPNPPDTQAGCELEYTPQDLWGMYDDPGASALTNADGTSTPSTLESSPYSLGQGQTMGIFGEGETSSVVAQLRLFERAMGLPKIPTRTVETQGGPDSAYGDNSGAIEWYLDSQSSTGMAPDASQLDFYFAKSLYDPDIAQAFSYWANDPNGPRQMNASFGECEANPTNPVTGPLAQLPYGTEYGDELEAVAEPTLEQATMEGRTLFSSAGDTGSGCPEIVLPVVGAGNGATPQPVPTINYPCASAYAVCVGGTVLSSTGNGYAASGPSASVRDAETSWTYGGGGQSYFIPQPDFQKGVVNDDGYCVSTPSGTPYTPHTQPCRGAPDVSDLSGNITGDGYFIYSDGEPSSEGGTSLSSPLMMGQWTRIQAASTKSTGLGFADETIYDQAKSADSCALPATTCPSEPYASEFYDVTQSENNLGNGAYRPGPGWDFASGWGSLNVANFMTAVDGSQYAAAPAGAPEAAAVPVGTATLTSPAGNAIDPADGETDSGLDLTQATLTTAPDGSSVTATLTVPDLGAVGSADESFYVAWEYGGEVYYAKATDDANSFSYTSGNTGTYGDASTYGYDDTASSAATGSVDATTGTITITVPASEVGASSGSGALPIGAHLTDPQAFDQLAGETADSSDDLTPASQDGGASVSVGEDVVVGGAPSGVSSTTGTSPGGASTGGTTTGGTTAGGASAGATTTGGTTTGGTSGTTTTTPAPREGNGAECAAGGGPIAHVRAKHLNSHRIRLSGVASPHRCGALRRVGVSIARRIGHRCRFLRSNGRFGRLTGCSPRDFLSATGTTTWRFTRSVHLAHGVYRLWLRAIDTAGRSVVRPAHRPIILRVR